jgi:hypothetical protein
MRDQSVGDVGAGVLGILQGSPHRRVILDVDIRSRQQRPDHGRYPRAVDAFVANQGPDCLREHEPADERRILW